MTVAGHFLPGVRGPVFILRRGPEAATRCVLVIPPFAEEMNKSRRMVTEVALKLEQHGIATVIPDLFGTGDSGGDFADADWSCWMHDLVRVVDWCHAQVGPVEGVLAVRLGCAMSINNQLLKALADLKSSVFWQPVFDGNRFLTQFLRLRIAANLSLDVKESVAELRARLHAGETLEVAGYAIASGLAAELDAQRNPTSLPLALHGVHWFELVREAGIALPSRSLNIVESSKSAGLDIEVRLLVGEPFWTATEIVINNELVNWTVQSFVAGLQA